MRYHSHAGSADSGSSCVAQSRAQRSGALPVLHVGDEDRLAALDGGLRHAAASGVVGALEHRLHRGAQLGRLEPRRRGEDVPALEVDRLKGAAVDVEQHADLREDLLERVAQPASRRTPRARCPVRSGPRRRASWCDDSRERRCTTHAPVRRSSRLDRRRAVRLSFEFDRGRAGNHNGRMLLVLNAVLYLVALSLSLCVLTPVPEGASRRVRVARLALALRRRRGDHRRDHADVPRPVGRVGDRRLLRAGRRLRVPVGRAVALLLRARRRRGRLRRRRRPPAAPGPAGPARAAGRPGRRHGLERLRRACAPAGRASATASSPGSDAAGGGSPRWVASRRAV